MNTAPSLHADGTPLRAWVAVHKDGKAHGFTWFSDAQMLERLERGEQWLPFTATLLADGRRAARVELAETIAGELAA